LGFIDEVFVMGVLATVPTEMGETEPTKIVSKKLKSIISQHKPCGDDLGAHTTATTGDGSSDSLSKSGVTNDDESLAKFRDKILNLKSQIQEDIYELSSEDEQ
jgi:hypothetical protein